jgi:hypothetical protein
VGHPDRRRVRRQPGLLPPPEVIMTNKAMHQMRVWPPAWTRPLDDRPPYLIWPIGGLPVWVGILTVYMSLDHTYLSRAVMWGSS